VTYESQTNNFITFHYTVCVKSSQSLSFKFVIIDNRAW